MGPAKQIRAERVRSQRLTASEHCSVQLGVSDWGGWFAEIQAQDGAPCLLTSACCWVHVTESIAIGHTYLQQLSARVKDGAAHFIVSRVFTAWRAVCRGITEPGAEHKGIWRGPNHMALRNQCLNMLREHYGMLLPARNRVGVPVAPEDAVLPCPFPQAAQPEAAGAGNSADAPEAPRRHGTEAPDSQDAVVAEQDTEKPPTESLVRPPAPPPLAEARPQAAPPASRAGPRSDDAQPAAAGTAAGAPNGSTAQPQPQRPPPQQPQPQSQQQQPRPQLQQEQQEVSLPLLNSDADSGGGDAAPSSVGNTSNADGTTANL